jgi:subtilisin family serine protease
MTHPFLHAALLVVAALASSAPAHAQLGALPRLPSLPSPVTTTTTDTGRLLRQTTTSTESSLAPLNLLGLRQLNIDELWRRDRNRYERDPAGELMLRAELTLFAPDAALLASARALGYTLLRERVLDGLDTRVVVLRAPAGQTTAAALAQLRALEPSLAADFNHVYTPSGATDAGAAPSPASAAPVDPAPGLRIGLIDNGIDTRHPALRAADVRRRGCSGASPAPASPHGTAVASLLVGQAGAFHGVLPRATLFAADVSCGDAAVDAIADALGWFVRSQVPVINISLVGPANRTLEQVVRAVSARGHVIVAAVGNDGPAAPPLYPAAYPGVVGVTGVDPRRRVLPEALQGPQVMFAAPGSALAVASGEGYAAARGTSFAAPLVAGLLAARLRSAEPAAAARVVADLAREAIDLGTPGRDPVYGEGLVGERERIDPLALR